MGDGLHFPFVQTERFFYQSLAIAGGAGVYDLRVCRQLLMNLADGADGGVNGTAVVVAVKGIEQGAVFSDQGNLGGGGTCVDPQIAAAFVSGKISFLYSGSCVPLDKFLVFGRIPEQRVHPGDFKFHMKLAG